MSLNEIQEANEKLERSIKIQKANDLVKSMQDEVKKYTKLLELAKADQVETVKHNVNYHEFDLMIPHAQEYLSSLEKDSKIDKRSTEFKGNKLMYEELTTRLSELLKQKIKITKIVGLGYEGYGYEIDFNVEDSDVKYCLIIPVVESISLKNFQYIHRGQLALGYYRNDNCQYIEYTTYYKEWLADKLKAMMENYKEGEE